MDNEPGIGFLVGMKWGQQQNEADFAAEKRRLLQRLQDEQAKEMVEESQKDALRAVANAIVVEEAQVQSGARKVRRLSDPKNVAARCEDFIDTAEGSLNRLSSGRLSFNAASFSLVNTAKEEPHKVARASNLNHPTADVQPEPVAPRRSKPR